MRRLISLDDDVSCEKTTTTTKKQLLWSNNFRVMSLRTKILKEHDNNASREETVSRETILFGYMLIGTKSVSGKCLQKYHHENMLTPLNPTFI